MANNPDIINIQLNYNINQLLDPNSWDGDFRVISLHGSIEYLSSDIKIIKELLSRMEKFILGKSIDSSKANNIKDFEGLGKAAWGFISVFYSSQWDSLLVDGTNYYFRNNIKSQFSLQVAKEATKAKESNVFYSPYVSTLPSPILTKSVKEVNEISKYFKKQQPINQESKLYVQVSARQANPANIARKTLKIKEVFPKLQNKKIEIVQKIINSQDKPKPKINMTTKGLSHKQVIVLMKSKDANILIKNSSMHIININWILKNIKSSVIVDYICIGGKDIVITTNNIASPSDLQAIEKYVKNMSCVDTNQVQSPRLPQSKLYLKIVGILYLSEATNSHIISEEIENILKNTHIFNNVVLASKPRIIKVFLKSDIAII